MNQLHCPTCESVIKESWNYCTICRTKLKEERKMVERVEGLQINANLTKESLAFSKNKLKPNERTLVADINQLILLGEYSYDEIKAVLHQVDKEQLSKTLSRKPH